MTDTTLVQRLREIGEWSGPKQWEQHPVAREAADEIDRLTIANKALTAENTRLIEKGFDLISECDEARKHLRRALEIACRNEASSDLDAAQSFLASKGE